MFDVITPAVVAADLTIGILLDDARARRGWSSSTRSTRRCPGWTT